MNMISISKITHKALFLLLLYLIFLSPVSAQETLTLSVTPTLFEMTANPGQLWQSSVKIINSNPYDINVYVDVVNFEPNGETGQPRFVPVDPNETQGSTLAEWVDAKYSEVTVPAEKTLEIPFSVQVPENAPPGGHFSAILVGTKSLGSGDKKTKVETSQVVTSLLFLRVTGEVIESGNIRSFRTLSKVAEKPEMDFELRFENKGNVHILPQGDITIYNMWGQERGVIPVNRDGVFGNVLPEQIRKFQFRWSGEWSLSDMGRYKAVVTVGYGEEARQFSDKTTTFWVIPWKILGTVILVIVLFISLLVWSIKLYIRKMLQMAGVNSLPTSEYQRPRTVIKKSVKKVSLVSPLEEGILDLRSEFSHSENWSGKFTVLLAFVSKYRLFFGVALASLVFIGLIVVYVRSALVENRAYEVVLTDVDSSRVISSEDVEYEKLKSTLPDVESLYPQDFPQIKIVNQSGVVGLGARLRILLEQKGFVVSELSSDFDTSRDKTVIVYDPALAEKILELSQFVDRALLSAYDSGEDTVVVYVGKDFEQWGVKMKGG